MLTIDVLVFHNDPSCLNHSLLPDKILPVALPSLDFFAETNDRLTISVALTIIPKQLVKIGKWYPSSQLCHVCGFQNDATKDLSVREWDCPKCGSHHNRDKNAAIMAYTPFDGHYKRMVK
ncbi:zinc ribbon domain-containing protein [Selenomonas sp.]|uniref:zinc ribbon domain-containing protein n=1 Tax=Selenomonas sp. TaxID=2053611 RepID=UPI003A100BD7